MRNKLGILLISLHMKLYCYADYASKWVCQLSRNIVALGVVRCTWLARCHLVEVVTTVSMLEKLTPIHHINHGHRGPISCLAVNIAIIHHYFHSHRFHYHSCCHRHNRNHHDRSRCKRHHSGREKPYRWPHIRRQWPTAPGSKITGK